MLRMRAREVDFKVLTLKSQLIIIYAPKIVDNPHPVLQEEIFEPSTLSLSALTTKEFFNGANDGKKATPGKKNRRDKEKP